MTNAEMITKIEELKTWEALLEEAKAEAEAIRDELKAEMLNKEPEELDHAGKYIMRWTRVTSNRFDSASFKRALPDLYKAYLKQSLSRRFSISA